MSQHSHSSHLCETILNYCNQYQAQTRLLDLCRLDLPMFRAQPNLPAHPGLEYALQSVEWADAILLVSPDYHGSMSGCLKNFLDYHWSSHAGKLFGYGCVSMEKGLTVMEQMRTAIRQCYGWSMPYGISVHGKSDFDQDGNMSSENKQKRAQMLARDMVIYGSLLRSQFLGDLETVEEYTFASKYRKKV